jgi:hypothetical protein
VGQGQESGGAGGAARGGGRLALTKPSFKSVNERPIVPKTPLGIALIRGVYGGCRGRDGTLRQWKIAWTQSHASTSNIT